MVDNKDVLTRANAAIRNGDHEGFLSCCSDDVVWEFVGDRTIEGKDAVRRYIDETYLSPPRFDVAAMVADGDLLVAVGEIVTEDDEGREQPNAYCDVWRFREGQMVELRAFVVPTT